MSAGVRSSPVAADSNHNTKSPLSVFPTFSKGELTTFGLSREWSAVFSWAQKNQVATAIILAIDVLRLRQYPFRFRVLLENLLTPEAQSLLDEWQEQNAMAQLLRELSRAAKLDPAVFDYFGQVTRGVSARNQLLGELQESYLYALLVEHIDAPTKAQRDWLITLREWLLVTALHHGQGGNVQDGHLRNLAKGIRLACEPRAEWSKLVAEFEVEPTNFDELTSHLNFRAYQLQQYQKDLGGEQKKFLRSLIEITEGRSSPEDRVSGFPLLTESHDRWNLSGSRYPSTLLDAEESEAETPPQIIGGSDDFDTVGVETCDPQQSYVQQLLSAKSVYLLNAEELHFLPWSWNKPNPAELEALTHWIDGLLTQENRSKQLLGVMVWIARATGRSLARVLEVEFSDQPAVEWQISIQMDLLHRTPPARHSAWQPGPHEKAWVTPITESNQIYFPQKVRGILKLLMSEILPARLGDAWPDDQTPSAWFTKELPTELSRLTPGMLPGVLPQRVFEMTGDGAYARLLAAGPKTGLPGSCAYGSWNQATVKLSLNNDSFPIPLESETNQIGAGSRLEPLESKLIESIAEATQVLGRLQGQGDWLVFHNGFVAWLTVSLLAATGARPVRDPFESIMHFDLIEGFVFVDDKSSGASRDGRLVLLPKALVRQIKQYRQYLRQLAKCLVTANPWLADGIANTAQGKGPAALPFLFLLKKQDGVLDWESVSESAISSLGLFSWPLPLNLFRHRLAQQLRRRGIDSEIIDGVLGHAEFGCATYGNDSTRRWQDDMRVLRPAIESAYAILGFKEINPVVLSSSLDLTQSGERQSIRKFGTAARQDKRNKTIERARQQAEQLIQQFCTQRTLLELNEDELWELSKKLLLSQSGLPLATGYERYSVLTERLDAEWKNAGRRIKVKRRFLRLQPPASQFTRQAPGVLSWHGDALMQVEAWIDAHWPTANVFEKGCWASALLSLDGRVANPQILADVSCGLNYRITVLQGQYDLEYADHAGLDDPDATVERFPINPKLANLLSGIKLANQASREELSKATEQRKRKVGKTLVALLRGGTARVENRMTVEEYFDALARQVDQVNVITLPVVMAAWFGGRVQSVSIGWRDRIRMTLGAIPDFGSADASAVFSDTEVAVARSLTVADPDTAGSQEELQQAARSFFTALRGQLGTTADPSNTRLAPERRRDLGNSINKLIRDHDGKAAQAILLLGQWIKELIHGQVEGHRQLKISAIARYLSALSPMFEAHAYAVNLLVLDDEEVTELYAAMLGSLDQDDPAYAAARLADFQRWATKCGVETPDWSEMPVFVKARRLSPGLIREEEYQQSIALIHHSTSISPEERRSCAFLLVCCYRFGLRGGEALGLRRDDWRQSKNEQLIVTVRNHPWRTLKSDAARRVVPLLFKLTKLELSIIDAMLVRYASLHGDDETFPLFSEHAADKSLRGVGVLKRIVIGMLKQVTGNPSINLHHARHSAANRVAAQVLGLEHPAWRAAACMKRKSFDHPATERILLGRCGPSRRQSWAIARYLGHAGTQTLWNSYVHLLPDWAREHLNVMTAGPGDAVPIENIVCLDDLPRHAMLGMQLLEQLPAPATGFTLSTALQYLRLIGHGKSAEAASTGLGIRLQDATVLHGAAIKIGKRLRLSLDKHGNERDNEDGLGFLRRYPEKTWSRLIDFANAHCPESSPIKSGSNYLDTLTEIIGATGQVLMWEARHCALIREFVTYMGIHDDEFQVTRTRQWHPDLEQQCMVHGFKVCAPEMLEKKIQIDTALPVSVATNVARRASLIYSENKSRLMRSRLDFVLVLLAFAAAKF